MEFAAVAVANDWGAHGSLNSTELLRREGMVLLLMMQGASGKGPRDLSPIHHKRDLASSGQV